MWTVYITDNDDRNPRRVLMTTPIDNPDNAPAIIEVEGKLYHYAGWSLGVVSCINYHPITARKGRFAKRNSGV